MATEPIRLEATRDYSGLDSGVVGQRMSTLDVNIQKLSSIRDRKVNIVSYLHGLYQCLAGLVLLALSPLQAEFPSIQKASCPSVKGHSPVPSWQIDSEMDYRF